MQPRLAAGFLFLIAPCLSTSGLLAQRFSDLPLEHLPRESAFGITVAAGDIDGDLDPDLLFAGSSGQTQLYRNLGSGRFAAQFGVTPPAGNSTLEKVRLLDVDGDGDLDVIAVRNVARPLQWRNEGNTFVDATVARMPNISLLGDFGSILDGDVDGDGDLDLVIVGYTVTLLRNTGAGTFVHAAAAFPGQPVSGGESALVDVDADGDLDLVGSRQWYPGTGRHLCYINNGSGVFQDQSAMRLPLGPAGTEGGGAWSMAAGDIDGDGDADLVAPLAVDDLSIYRNNGSGTFLDRVSIPLGGIVEAPYNIRVELIRLVDVDGDGDLDMLFCVQGGYGRHLLLNDGMGGFTAAPVGGLPQSRNVIRDQVPVDLDGDGDLDLVQATPTENWMSWNVLSHAVLWNDSRGRFVDAGREAIDHVLDPPVALAAVDFDRDGLLDLVRAIPSTFTRGMLWIERNQGDGTFVQQQRIPYDDAALGAPFAIVVADVDADGLEDLYVSMTSGRDAIFRAQGNGEFAIVGSLPTATSYAIEGRCADFDADGDLDLVTARVTIGPSSVNTGELLFWANDGHGNFVDQTTARLPLLPARPISLEMCDLEGDGDLDLILGTTQSALDAVLVNGGAGVFTNELQRIPPAGLTDFLRAVRATDLDLDGRVDLVVNRGGGLLVWRGSATGVFTDVSAQWNPLQEQAGAFRLADFDADGRTDVLRVNGDPRVLRNLGSTFQSLPSVSDTVFQGNVWPTMAVVADFDDDGDLDVVYGSAFYGNAQWNLRRQVQVPRLALTGQSLPIRVHARNGGNEAPRAAVVALASDRIRTITPFGTCWLDLQGLLELRAVITAAGSGQAEFLVGVPPLPSLQGLELTVQALLFGATGTPGFTNAVTTTIR